MFSQGVLRKYGPGTEAGSALMRLVWLETTP
jgi:hypothetical protein